MVHELPAINRIPIVSVSNPAANDKFRCLREIDTRTTSVVNRMMFPTFTELSKPISAMFSVSNGNCPSAIWTLPRLHRYGYEMECLESARIYIAGHRGLVGSSICRALHRVGCQNLIVRTHAELDLLDTALVKRFFANEKPSLVFLAAARVGGILANDTRPAEFLFENLQIQNSVIHAAHDAGVRKLLFLGSSCIYPKHASQPIREDSLLSAPLEPTNEWYAIAKIAGVKMCQAYRKQYGADFISVMPTNLYGPNDNYDPAASHVLPALIRRFHEAKIGRARSVTCWGSGAPFREFLHADDLARACLFLMENYSDEQIINVGSGQELSIRQLAETVARVVGFNGEINWDTSKPDGTPRKLLDSSRLFALGWRPQIDLETGIQSAYEDFLDRYAS
jgi:GDP-L-fucose synthase